MSELKERLIESAVRPFDDNAESQMAATRLLGDMVVDAPEDAEAAIARWNALDAKRRKPVWRIVLWGVLVLATFWVIARDSNEVVRFVRWGNWMNSFSIFSPTPMPIPQMTSDLDLDQKLLFSTDSLWTDSEDRKEALWRSDPENPAYFAEYASFFAGKHGSLPPNFLMTTRNIDPENAWFTYLAAAVEGTDAVKQNQRSAKLAKGKRVYSEPLTWQIIDQSRLDAGLNLLRKLENPKKFENFSLEMFSKRRALLPATHFIEHLDTITLISVQSHTNNIKLRKLADLIAAVAWSAAESGDLDKFRATQRLGEDIVETMFEGNVGSVVDELVLNVIAITVAQSFKDGSARLGLNDEAQRWKRVWDHLDDRNQEKQHRPLIVDGKATEGSVATGQFLGGSLRMVAQQVSQQPPLTDFELMPGRMIDQNIFSRFFSYASWLVMGICLVTVAAYRLRVPLTVRRLASRTEALLHARDWAWILGAGVLLPAMYLIAVNRLTPLGGNQVGMAGTGMLLPFAHFLGLILLWLTAAVQIARRTLAKRAKVLDFTGPSWFGLIAVACAAGFVPLIGWAAIGRSYPAFWEIWVEKIGFDIMDPSGNPHRFWIAMAVLAVPVLWIWVSIAQTLLCRSQRIVEHAAVARTLVPTFAAAMLLLALASVAFKANERVWFQRDTLSKVDPAKPGWSSFEHDVAVQMRKEVQEIWEGAE